MYALSYTKSNTDKIVAGFVTAFLLTGLYFFLRSTSLPEIRLQTETYEEINWTRFTPKPKTIIDAPRPVKIDKPIKIEMPLPPSKPAAVEKADLSTLKNLPMETLSRPTPSLRQKNLAAAAGATTGSELKIDLKNSSVLSGTNTLLGDSSTKLKLPTGGRGGSDRGHGNPTLTAGSGRSVEMGSGTDYGGDSPTLGAPQAKAVGRGSSPQIAMVDLTDFGGDYSDLSPIYRALVEWMKRHPAEFPEVVSRFMEKSPNDLTSIVSFQIGGRQFEMFLLCKEKLFEVRVCLLEGDESTYLIDRGFKEKSSYLRVGRVNRSDNDTIQSFGTVRQAASNQRTQQFYQIFLSWWESVKQ